MDIWIELLDEGNLIDHPGLSIGIYRPGISSLSLRGGKGSLDGNEAEHDLTNLSTGVGARVVSRILIMEGLVDFPTAEGRRPLWFHRARVQRLGSIKEPPDIRSQREKWP